MSCGADAAPTRQQCNRTTEANPKQHCAAADCIQSGVLARHTSHGRPMDNTRGLRAMNVGFQSLGWQLPGCSNFCNGSIAVFRKMAIGDDGGRLGVSDGRSTCAPICVVFGRACRGSALREIFSIALPVWLAAFGRVV